MLGSDSPSRFPNQRWQIAPQQPVQAADLAHKLDLPDLLAQVLLNRGIDTFEAAQVFLNPELQLLPSPLEEFEDLPIALELLLRAIADRQYIAICGDYDADGMTSTALLLRALRCLGATVEYAIPSRMQEGYGINRRIIEEFHQEGVGLILTVDNGIAAHEPIARARELGMAVIVTDHHDLPPTLPDANAILNPKLIREDSPYRGVAGVGVAYILAVCLAQSLQKMQDLTTPLIELFTLGTIADLAPLTGVNRRWVKRGLKLLPKSKLAGVQALIQVAGLSNEKALKPEAIGFRLGPRINAIGRLADPQIVIELLTTDEDGRALELAMKCEQVNQLRQRLCELIEQEAIAWCQETGFDPQKSRVLVVVQPDWHHGVIGIVASRLVERYGVPVFIGTYEIPEYQTPESEPPEERDQSEPLEEPAIDLSTAKIRGSARGIPEFDVFAALQFCGDLLERFGGHRAAGGFTFTAENLAAFRSRLETFADQTLRPEHLKPLVTIDTHVNFRDLSFDLYARLDVLHPCGIENPDPVLWTANVQILEQKLIGRDQTHLKLTLAEVADPGYPFRAVAWRWGQFYPLPNRVDVAYRLRLNEWNGTQSVELEVVGVRLAAATAMPASRNAQLPAFAVTRLPIETETKFLSNRVLEQTIQPPVERATEQMIEQKIEQSVKQIIEPKNISIPVPKFDQRLEHFVNGSEMAASCFDVHAMLHTSTFDQASSQAALQIEFYYNKRKYTGNIYRGGAGKELRISNIEGQLLIIQVERRRGFIGSEQSFEEIDVSQLHYFNLVRSALTALELAETAQRLQEKEQQIAVQVQQIDSLTQQLNLLKQQMNAQHLGVQKHLLQQQTQIQQQSPIQLEPEIQQDSSLWAELQAEIQVVEPYISAEPHPPRPLSSTSKPEEIKQYLKAELGEVWDCLDLRSQKDLVAAYKRKIALQSESTVTTETASQEDCAVDYSDVGLRLCSVIERELIQPFFKEIHQFLLHKNERCEIGGVSLRARKKYTLGMLPPLLAERWNSLQEDALSKAVDLSEVALYAAVEAAHVNPNDRATVQAFLCQWKHSLAPWLQAQASFAASTVAQIDKLLSIAADAENVLQEHHFELLHSLILGNADQPGILRQIYSR
ncbi:MAG: single-stranded-DNA-specific exonuclease RecJ [Cyanobacteria bacterium RM1_2_2]|nr:single-stranded-DNA-specific exonuclease RecJ [Cyanobacteria bacterium RM1_2_2]